MDNKTKTDVLHDLIPKNFKTRHNPNWTAILKAIGESDQATADLLEEVRKQFFIKTADRPYLDKLGSNVSVVRPNLMGMDNTTYKKFIPVLAYQPKQVKAIIDQLLDVFFFKETTSAFTETGIAEPFYLKDGWELEYLVDGVHAEKIVFSTNDFTDIAAATASEIANAINRQASYSFAVVLNNPIVKTRSIRLFTKTIGSKGSVQITGGRANMFLQFVGFNTVSGSQSDTVWTISRIGDDTTFSVTDGTSPRLDLVQVGDIAILDLAGTSGMPTNQGSFAVTAVDISNNTFTLVSVFAEEGVYDHSATSNAYVRFFTPEKAVIFTQSLRAISWEVRPGEIVVEVPASPPVPRGIVGAAHINGLMSEVQTTPSVTELTLDDASDWPTTGRFVLQLQNEIQHYIDAETTTSCVFNSRFDKQNIYQYTSKNGNILSGITPNLPTVTNIYRVEIDRATRDARNKVVVTTLAAHGLTVGDSISVAGTTLAGTLTISPDGCHTVSHVFSTTSFAYIHFGDVGYATGGHVTTELAGMALSGSLVYLTTSLLDTGILGPYIWDTNAPFVLGSITAELSYRILAGETPRSIQLTAPNSIPDEEGYIVFDLGEEQEEGPVRYTAKPNSSLLEIDPTYTFKFNHLVGAPIIIIRRRGAHIMSGLGLEMAPYITDPVKVRDSLQELIEKVKSVGIFLNFIVRAPEQYYATLEVYGDGVDPG